MGIIGTIARTTFRQAVRKPVFVVVLLIGAALLAINPFFSSYTFEDDNMLLLELGLSTLLLAGLVLAAFTATGVLNEEIDNRTLLTVLSKPIGRTPFLVGKFIGVLLALVAAEWVWILVFLLTVRHRVLMTARDSVDVPVILFGLGGMIASIAFAGFRNYTRRREFTTALLQALVVVMPVATLLAFTFDKEWGLQSPLTDLDPQLLCAMALVLEATAVCGALAVALSTRCGQGVTLVALSSIFATGLASEQLWSGSASDDVIGSLAYVLAPNMQYLWLADAINQQIPVEASYMLLVTCYSFLYIVATLSVAIALFTTREVG
ncbi:MAG: ABC transporter permease subunit [Planctomycetes bacterium]|nr:ABC transporter permease subunit [Planctomycetota bacterium]